jgi:flagellar FliL protein
MADAKAATLDEEVETEAETEEGAEGEGGQSKKKFGLKLPAMSMKMMIIIGGAFLVLVGGGIGTYLMFFSSSHEAKPEASAVKPVMFVDLPELIVNLSNPSGERTQYLKIKVVLEVADQKMIEQITPIMPRVMDAFQTYLRELRPNDLDGSAGLYRLKEELTRRVNVSVAPSRVNAVLFKEIIVQ